LKDFAERKGAENRAFALIDRVRPKLAAIKEAIIIPVKHRRFLAWHASVDSIFGFKAVDRAMRPQLQESYAHSWLRRASDLNWRLSAQH